MRLALTTTAMTMLLGAGIAGAQGPTAQHRDPFMNTPVEQTVYATDRHMAFSIRNSLIRWLGGVSVARERDIRAAQREAWWGEPVPQVPPELARSADH